MKVTRILGFSEDEIESLKKAGNILGAFAAALNEETADEIKLDDTAIQLATALKEVLGRII